MPRTTDTTPRRRSVWILVAIALGLGWFAHGGLPGDSQAEASKSSTSRSAGTALSATDSSSPSASVARSPRSGTALAAVTALVVRGRGPMTGYSRAAFGQTWYDADRNGCDTRNDVLRRDLVDRSMKNACKVMSGTLADPYTGSTVLFAAGGASEVDVDHVVSLGDAWQKGAARWGQAKRLAFANDPLNLLVVGSRVNRSEGDGDTATWLPKRKASRCGFVARQVAVKQKYGLSVTAAERAAMSHVLASCPQATLPRSAAPTEAPLPRVRAAPPAPSPSPARPRALVQAPTSVGTVHPGSYCSSVGARGETVRGTPMVCSAKAGDDRARWRAA